MKKSRKLNSKSFATFGEEYEISLDYQKSDGYWVMSHLILVSVPVVYGINEKDNHDKAEAIAKKLYPNCKINKIVYC
jgi:hypothetical protein